MACTNSASWVVARPTSPLHLTVPLRVVILSSEQIKVASKNISPPKARLKPSKRSLQRGLNCATMEASRRAEIKRLVKDNATLFDKYGAVLKQQNRTTKEIDALREAIHELVEKENVALSDKHGAALKSSTSVLGRR
jgi:ElaB/YqjD/DUF883 family membrane-anchored ribosome-binding protein